MEHLPGAHYGKAYSKHLTLVDLVLTEILLGGHIIFSIFIDGETEAQKLG